MQSFDREALLQQLRAADQVGESDAALDDAFNEEASADALIGTAGDVGSLSLGQTTSVELGEEQENSYFDSFTREYKTEILDKIDGPNGFFAHAQESRLIEQVHPHTAEAIDAIDDDALVGLGVTKDELKTVSAAFGAGQARSNLTAIKVPTEVAGIEDGVAHTDVGDLPLGNGLEGETNNIPRGCFIKTDGELWLVATELHKRYPDPEQRRIATLWTFSHEQGHGILGYQLMNVLTGQDGQAVILPDGTEVDAVTQLQGILNELPTDALTDYSGKYYADGKAPDREEAPIGYIRAVEEEMCETVATTMFGFAPRTDIPATDALHNPAIGREQFHDDVWNFVRAGQK